MIVVGLWSISLAPGQSQTVVPQADIRITNVALGAEVADASGRTVVKVTYEKPVRTDTDDEEDAPENLLSTTVLCSLTAGKIEQSMVDIIIEQDEEYVFESVGKNTVYITGNYVDQSPGDMPYGTDSNSDLDSEEAYDLREVSSDVEIDPDELDSDASRFEEIDEKTDVKSLKRSHDLDAVDSDAQKTSKREEQLNKKQKAADGKAVPPSQVEEKKEKKSKKDKREKKEGAGDAAKAEQKDKSAVVKEVAGGVKIKDTKVGTGAIAKKGNMVGMRYIGKLPNGKIFDQNVKGKPFTFRLGKGEVIKGWDEGIVGMQVGGERLLTIPPNMGYGKKGSDGIPGGSTLIFECKLLEIR